MCLCLVVSYLELPGIQLPKRMQSSGSVSENFETMRQTLRCIWQTNIAIENGHL